jgi:predicted SAM-dependent methyltransferase
MSAASYEALYVHYGCGICAPAEWLNFDASPRLRLERTPGLGGVLRSTMGLLFPLNVRFGDIVRGLPVRKKSAYGVFCSHVLEHLARDDLAPALRNTIQILRPGGIFRLVVPDLQWRALRYVTAAASGKPFAADQFMFAANLGRCAQPKNMISRARECLGHSAHLWMYDFASLKQRLEEAGFVAIRRCDLGDARDRMFDLVEETGRFFDGGERELAIEAAAPL